ncbi:uncharacterized protein LOC133506038 [Syngnathoides biaculeatus]|uniref:uncharacterized protein LOC133506038 n=1 Tax=Syngnathoides biaculeatus TaxID=300417 RepID=UPI002ADDF181|nr:uncharacterized protein LOC133506038 [Syngnathoides biaculeatus]
MLQLTVVDTPVQMLVDTGATHSSINMPLPSTALSRRVTTLVGFSGRPQTLPFTRPLKTEITNTGQKLYHSYVHAMDTPINLMGRDMLSALRAQILCGEKGLTVTFPGEQVLECSQPVTPRGQWLMAPLPTVPETAPIYWARLNPETPLGGGVYSTSLLWKPWIQALAPYHPPVDPLHCTLYYDRDSDEVYRDAFEEIEGVDWTLQSPCIFVGPEGVAANVQLSPEQEQWFKMGEEGLPHVTLAVSPGHEPRQLGPMVKRLTQQHDWMMTEIPDVWHSATTKSYRIMAKMVDESDLELVFLDRHHGRELTHHESALAMLDQMPQTLWSHGPFDVGFCHTVQPIQLEVDCSIQVRRPQYRWPKEADKGMEDTVAGLWDAGVLETSAFSWNTPLRPVQKADGVTWRMAHDLRPLNDITITPVFPVPDPHRILSSLDPQKQWYTVIDLANAYFCLPLAESIRHVFAISYKGVKLQYKRLPQGFKNSPGIFNQVLKDFLFSCELSQGSVLLQYVDDLLIAAETSNQCVEATRAVLLKLADLGFKVSRKKLQCCRKSVVFLGRVITPAGLAMSPNHRSSILRHPRPETVLDMLSFLGLCGYSRA